MRSKFINVLIFAAGAAIGSAVTWKVLKTKYERIAQEEIDSVKEAFADRFGTNQEQTEGEDDEEVGDRQPQQINWDELEDLDEDDDENYVPTESDLNKYGEIASTYGGEADLHLNSRPTPITNEKGGADDMAREPYVIAPYDFGELDGYHQVELTYYEGDDTLEDDEYNIINDRDELLGPKALTTFGEYEDDSVFVRNEKLRTDFQILKDPRTYKQARSIGPDQVDDE